MTLTRTLAAVIVAASLSTGATAATAGEWAGWSGTAGTGEWSPPPRAGFMRTECLAEDSLNCAWNARKQGNGHGASFYAVRVKLLGRDGHRLGVVGCHYLVDTANRPHLSRFDSCQVLHRR